MESLEIERRPESLDHLDFLRCLVIFLLLRLYLIALCDGIRGWSS